ncbi:MAG: hypothetical protein IOD03_21190 [Methylocystis sp.]|jgi:hypothetical protein|nr:hypothetical protein [Methylocystis sp.]
MAKPVRLVGSSPLIPNTQPIIVPELADARSSAEAAEIGNVMVARKIAYSQRFIMHPHNGRASRAAL